MDNKNSIKESFNSIIEESEDSIEMKISSRRTKSLGKLVYSKITKKLKKNSPPKIDLSLNIYNSISTPRLQDISGKKKASISDYDIICELGNGSYGKVILAKNKYEGKQFAIKAIKKSLLNQFDKQYEVHVEKYCLAHLSHPNIIKFNKAFQDKKHLFFVLEYCKNKDLGKLIQRVGTFSFKLAQYYAAEILSAISYMNKCGIYHRDIKPENIAVDEDMHLKLCDFATANMVGKYFDTKIMNFVDISQKDYQEAVQNAKSNESKNNVNNYVLIGGHKIMNLTEQFVGTPEYISPEVLEYKYDLIGPSVDIWAFGVILYLFFVGKTPFKGENDDETLNNIRNVKYSFEFEKKNINMPKEAKDLIEKILIKDPRKRIGFGSKDYKEIKEHPFFKGINFDNLFEEPIPLNKIYPILETFGYIINKDKLKENEKDDDIYINVLSKGDNDTLFDDNSSIGSADNAADLKTSFRRLNYNNINLFRSSLSGSLNNLKDNLITENINKSQTPKSENQLYDQVLIEDILYKKSTYIHYNKRYVKLFSKGHLDYYDCSSKLLKGSIIINESTKAYPLDDFRFEILSQNKIYNFKHISKRVSDNWVEKINNIIIEKIRSKKLKY
jgi:serine/threonine protein kinase